MAATDYDHEEVTYANKMIPIINALIIANPTLSPKQIFILAKQYIKMYNAHESEIFNQY
jgi:hypothetical protein